jgi:pilus assembly protein Flp/PilA
MPQARRERMQKISDFVTRALAKLQSIREESGQTLVEYGLIVALLSIAAIVILSIIGQDIVNIFTKVSTTLQDAQTP